MYFEKLRTEAWLNWRRDRQEERAIKRRENERIRFHQPLEDYRAALRIREIQNRDGMGGNSNVEIMNYISRQLTAGRLTAIVSIDQDGIITIKYEPNNKKVVVRPNAVDENGLTGHQLQEILTILTAQSECNYNFIKLMEARKHNLDVTVDELVQLFAGGVKASQANNSSAEHLRIEEKPKAVSGILSRVEEKNGNRRDGENEETSQMEIGKIDFADLCSSNCDMSPHMTPPLARPLPADSAWFHSESPASHKLSEKLEPLGQGNRLEVKQEGLPDKYSGRLPLPREQTSFIRGYEVQQGPPLMRK